jgi:hypothetical protein
LLVDVLGEIRQRLPFPLLGLDVDNDTVFMNETVRDYCAAERIELTRCRPYRKNDQAHVEQKNGEIVRRMVGYRRYEGMAAAVQLARLYAPVRLFVNAFQPSFKLAEKALGLSPDDILLGFAIAHPRWSLVEYDFCQSLKRGDCQTSAGSVDADGRDGTSRHRREHQPGALLPNRSDGGLRHSSSAV